MRKEGQYWRKELSNRGLTEAAHRSSATSDSRYEGFLNSSNKHLCPGAASHL